MVFVWYGCRRRFSGASRLSSLSGRKSSTSRTPPALRHFHTLFCSIILSPLFFRPSENEADVEFSSFVFVLFPPAISAVIAMLAFQHFQLSFSLFSNLVCFRSFLILDLSRPLLSFPLLELPFFPRQVFLSPPEEESPDSSDSFFCRPFLFAALEEGLLILFSPPVDLGLLVSFFSPPQTFPGCKSM